MITLAPDPPAAPPARSSEPIRALHVVASLHRGGMETALLRQLQHWASRRPEDEHTLIVLGPCDPELLASCESLRAQTLGASGRSLRSALRLRRIIRDFQPDVVHARATGGWLDAAIATRGLDRVRLLLGFHGREHLDPPGRLRRAALGWALRQASGVVTLSYHAAAWLRIIWRIAADHITVIPNGVDVQRFRPPAGDESDEMRAGLLIRGERFLVLCVANLVPIKGLEAMLAAWRRVCMIVPDARLVIAGDGPQRENLLHAAQALRVAPGITWLGRRADVAPLLRAADLFVLPSHYECCSNALLEAMASARPCVATSAGGNPELLCDHHTGWLVPPGDSRALATAVIAALLNPDARRRVAQAAREQACREHQLADVAERYRACYARLIRGSPGPSIPQEALTCAG